LRNERIIERRAEEGEMVERQKDLKKLLRALSRSLGWPHISIRRLLLDAAAIMVALQAIVVLTLQAVSILRRQKHTGGFPHPRFGPVTVGENTLQLYDYGRELYDAMVEAIDEAQETIYLETYIWKDDEQGRRFKEHLERKADEGVDVYVIFDGFGNGVVPREFKQFPPNIHALNYKAIKRPWQLFDLRRYALDHRKLLVVDGKTSFIGGFNIGSLYATAWRDTHLRIEGPAAADLAQSFVDFWNFAEPARRRITRHYPRHFDPLINLRGTNAMRLTFPIRDMYIDAIDRAEHSIRLTNAYFVPDRSLFDALKAAAQRGVDVKVLVPWISNHVVVDWLTRGYFTECLKAGIHVCGYRNMLHAKTCTIDGQWSTIGTANLDRLSSVGNYEINVEVYSEDLAHEMEELFECDTKNAFELKLDEWNRRPWYKRLGEFILAPLRVFL
jgi:cardiolipin synthase A/B